MATTQSADQRHCAQLALAHFDVSLLAPSEEDVGRGGKSPPLTCASQEK